MSPKHEQEKCDGYIAIHDFAHSRKTVDPHLMTDEERAAIPPVRQPLTIDHDEHRGEHRGPGAQQRRASCEHR